MTNEEINQVLKDEDIRDELQECWLLIAIKMITHAVNFDDVFIAKTTGFGVEKIKKLRQKIEAVEKARVDKEI